MQIQFYFGNNTIFCGEKNICFYKFYFYNYKYLILIYFCKYKIIKGYQKQCYEKILSGAITKNVFKPINSKN